MPTAIGMYPIIHNFKKVFLSTFLFFHLYKNRPVGIKAKSTDTILKVPVMFNGLVFLPIIKISIEKNIKEENKKLKYVFLT
ncbi:MAG: hypothetical protein GXO22_07765 [Aquificae bacterium]|nr:hypothetical protein [Aquificota bacterium]